MLLIPTKRNVERLATYYQCTLTECIERLVNEKADQILEALDEAGRHAFLTQGLEDGQ